MPNPIEPIFPLTFTILAYVATGALVIIMLILVRVSRQLTDLSIRLNKTIRSSKLADLEATPNIVEAGTGTPFDEFLNEDTQRRKLSKKEQFKEYRKWRGEKGLNWDK